MTVGLPGAGIGGLFYLAGALLMPVRSLALTLTGRGHEARWRLAFRQSGMAVGILAALWLTGAILGRLVLPSRAPSTATHAGGGAVAGVATAHAAAARVIGTHALALSIGTLVLILVLVQVARLTVRHRLPPVRHRALPRESARKDDEQASRARSAAA